MKLSVEHIEPVIRVKVDRLGAGTAQAAQEEGGTWTPLFAGAQLERVSPQCANNDLAHC
jgi:hypothetical protein